MNLDRTVQLLFAMAAVAVATLLVAAFFETGVPWWTKWLILGTAAAGALYYVTNQER